MPRTHVVSLIISLFGVGMLTGPGAYAQEHFSDCVGNTGNNATLILSVSTDPGIGGEPLASGDEIAVFTSEGLCAGVASWDETNLSLAVWGDDTMTEDKDGFSAAEAFTYRVWDASAGVEYDGENAEITVTYDAEEPFYRSDGLYQESAIYVLSSLNVAPVATSDEPEVDLPDRFALHQNYPNPFNPETTVPFDLPQAADVVLKIYNMLGQEVATLVSERLPAGEHKAQWHATGMASGLYVYRLQAGETTLTRTLTVIK